MGFFFAAKPIVQLGIPQKQSCTFGTSRLKFAHPLIPRSSTTQGTGVMDHRPNTSQASWKRSTCARIVFCAIASLLISALCPPRRKTAASIPDQPSQSAVANGAYYALVIGIDDYPAPLPKLKTAVDDAKAVGALLHDRYRFRVTYLLDQNATRFKILDALARSPQRARPRRQSADLLRRPRVLRSRSAEGLLASRRRRLRKQPEPHHRRRSHHRRARASFASRAHHLRQLLLRRTLARCRRARSFRRSRLPFSIACCAPARAR